MLSVQGSHANTLVTNIFLKIRPESQQTENEKEEKRFQWLFSFLILHTLSSCEKESAQFSKVSKVILISDIKIHLVSASGSVPVSNPEDKRMYINNTNSYIPTYQPFPFHSRSALGNLISNDPK